MKTRMKVRVGWGDCDPAEIVFYPNFFRWFDESTHHLLREAGFDLSTLYKRFGVIGIPIIEAKSNFKIPSRFDEEIEFESHISEWREKSFTVTHRILKGEEERAIGHEVRAWAGKHPTDPNRLKAVPVPAEVKAKLGG